MSKSSTLLSLLFLLPMTLSISCTGKTTQPDGQKRSNAKAQEQTATKKKEKKNMEVKELTTQEFKEKVMNYDEHPNEWVFEGDKPVIIDFYATWCGPCKATAPIVADIAKTYAGKIDVYKVDVDQQQELAATFGIRSIPTIFFIPKKGDPQVQVGAMNRAQFDEAIKEILLPE